VKQNKQRQKKEEEEEAQRTASGYRFLPNVTFFFVCGGFLFFLELLFRDDTEISPCALSYFWWLCRLFFFCLPCFWLESFDCGFKGRFVRHPHFTNFFFRRAKRAQEGKRFFFIFFIFSSYII